VSTNGAVGFVSPAISRQRRQGRGILRRTCEPRVRQNRVVLAVVATVKLFAEVSASPTGRTASSFRGAREARRNSAPGRARH